MSAPPVIAARPGAPSTAADLPLKRDGPAGPHQLLLVVAIVKAPTILAGEVLGDQLVQLAFCAAVGREAEMERLSSWNL